MAVSSQLKSHPKLTVGGAGLTDRWHPMNTVRHAVATTLKFGFTFTTSGSSVKPATTTHFPIHKNSWSKSSSTRPDRKEPRGKILKPNHQKF
jgi:hypothetical protein